MDTSDLSSRELRRLAPEPFAAWDVVTAAASAAVEDEQMDLLRLQVASLLGSRKPAVSLSAARVESVISWPSSPQHSEGERALFAFTEQFVLDVGSTTEPQRDSATRALGSGAFAFVQALYVIDLGTRMLGAWRQLFETEPQIELAAAPGGLWPALEEFMRAVARLQALDPLTTELVRLRGARAHNCRLCKSMRSIRAANGGADESVYDQIDHYETSTLSPRHKAALRLVDAIIWQPLNYPMGLTDQLHESLSPAEVVEIVLDVARNAANKIAVALGADDAHVTEGLEYYDLDDRGDLVHGLEPSS